MFLSFGKKDSWLFTILMLVTLGGAIFAQRAYDALRLKDPPKHFPLSATYIRAFDLGLHTTAASFVWIDTMTQLPFLPNGFDYFKNRLETVNKLDSKFSFPYAFTTLVLPIAQNHPAEELIRTAIQVGEQGLGDADRDWRIPFHLGFVYHTDLKERDKAAEYFDLAARTEGAPEYVRRFGLNYGVLATVREQTKQLWQAIYEGAQDEETRERAKAHYVRLEIFDLLEEAAEAYKEKRDSYPKTPEDLVAAGLLREVLPDPFGFTISFNDQGRVSVAEGQ